MKQTKEIEVLVDDLDGTDATQTIAFSLNGATYEIDLNDKNARKFYQSIEPFARAGRTIVAERQPRKVAKKKATKKAAAKKATARNSRRPSDNQVRTWAIEQGIQVGKAGRVPAALREQFLAAKADEKREQAAA